MSELERYEKQFGKDAGYYRLKEKLDKIDKKYKLYKDMNIPVELQAKTIADNLYRNKREYIRKIEKIILHCKVGSIKELWYVRKSAADPPPRFWEIMGPCRRFPLRMGGLYRQTESRTENG